jgi:small subunit ribosomal protein S17
MPKRILQGTVTSTQNAQTVTVSVERRFTHPVLKKTIRKSKKYRAHDARDAYQVGDVVRIQECAPKSKTKRWEVVSSRNANMEWEPAATAEA